MKTLENFMLLHEKQGQQTLDFFRGFRLVLFPIFGLARRPANMGAENIQRCLAKILGFLRQMEEFVGPAQAHGIRPV